MKILLVNKFFYLKGGAERYMFTLADALKAYGHDVIFFSMQDKKNFPCKQEKYFVAPVGMHGSLKARLNMIFHIAYSREAFNKMTKLLIDEKPNLVIFNNIHKQLTCSIIDAIKKYNKDLPIYWICHDLITICPAYTMVDGKGHICEKCLDGNFNHCKENKCIHGSKIMSGLSTYEAKYIKKRQWYNCINKFICPSNFYRELLVKANFTQSPIIWMRNLLSLDAKYEINSHDDGYILYFGRLSKEKGITTLIDAMKNLKYKLWIVGTGPLEEELQQYVVSNQLNNVNFKGFKQGEELTDIIRNSRCVVLPSEWYENGPYSAIEAMELGKPLVVSNLGGLPELVENGKTGYIYSTKAELTENLEKMIAMNQNNYHSMCENCMNAAEKLFNPENYIRNLLELK